MSETIKNSTLTDSLFVYGTLMRGECRHHFLEAGGIKSIVPASIAGELFDLGEYPGLKLSSDEASRVSGELVELEALDKIILEVDEEEGPEYSREIVNATAVSGESRAAWTYVFSPASEPQRRIASGDWRSVRSPAQSSEIS